jgi:hypothetical protein
LELIENPALSEESVITTETANSISQKESLYLNLGFQSEHVSYVLKLLREDILVMFITNRDL